MRLVDLREVCGIEVHFISPEFPDDFVEYINANKVKSAHLIPTDRGREFIPDERIYQIRLLMDDGTSYHTVSDFVMLHSEASELLDNLIKAFNGVVE